MGWVPHLRLSGFNPVIEIGQVRAAACDPPREIADQIEVPPCALTSEAVFDGTRRVELDELSVGSILQSPEQPAPVQVLFRNHHLGQGC
jgi:hypothetical protein